jgi:hypothetical protein
MKTKPTIISREKAEKMLEHELAGKYIIRDYKKEKRISDLKYEIKQLHYELKECGER